MTWERVRPTVYDTSMTRLTGSRGGLLTDWRFFIHAVDSMHTPLQLRDPCLRVTLASYLLAAVALLLALWLHLLPALLAGLLVYELVQTISPLLGRRFSGDRGRMLVVALFGVLVIGLLTLLIFGVISLVHREIGNPRDLWQDQVMPLVQRAREQLPASLMGWLPDSVTEMRLMALDLTRKYAGRLQLVGRDAARAFVHILVGMVLGAIVALSHTRPAHQTGPLAASLSLRAQRLAAAFHNIVFAQIKISLINTAFTAIFLLGALPLFGVHVPLSKTLVVLTFVVGLLPVVGNLLSNTAVTIAALSVSLGVGIAALVFLILIHKLEYFLNARIVGTQIHARAWELLIAMLVMEAMFGLTGLIAAPIYYAYLKSELEAVRLI